LIQEEIMVIIALSHGTHLAKKIANRLKQPYLPLEVTQMVDMDKYKIQEEENGSIILNPEDATAYYNRANAMYRKEEYEKALEDYRKVLEIDPQFQDASYYLEICLEKLKR